MLFLNSIENPHPPLSKDASNILNHMSHIVRHGQWAVQQAAQVIQASWKEAASDTMNHIWGTLSSILKNALEGTKLEARRP